MEEEEEDGLRGMTMCRLLDSSPRKHVDSRAVMHIQSLLCTTAFSVSKREDYLTSFFCQIDPAAASTRKTLCMRSSVYSLYMCSRSSGEVSKPSREVNLLCAISTVKSSSASRSCPCMTHTYVPPSPCTQTMATTVDHGFWLTAAGTNRDALVAFKSGVTSDHW